MFIFETQELARTKMISSNVSLFTHFSWPWNESHRLSKDKIANFVSFKERFHVQLTGILEPILHFLFTNCAGWG
jgi:hypothetical protein